MTDADFLRLEEARQLSQASFIKEAAKVFGLEERGLAALLEHYELEVKGFCPADYDPVSLTMREIAQQVDLPIKVVRRLRDLNIIGNPITCGDFEFLKQYRATWGNVFLIKCQLANFSKKQRDDIMTRPELTTKWEKWVYSQFTRSEIRYGLGNRMITPERRVFIDSLVEDVHAIFGIPDCYNTRQRILKIREKANYDKKKLQRGDATHKEVMEKRRVSDTDGDYYTDPPFWSISS